MTGANVHSESPNITMIPENLEELNNAEVSRLVPTLVYLIFISVTGILGNSLVCHVYRTRYRLSNSQCFILCLSAIDLFSCCVVIPLEAATIVEQYTFKHLWLCKISRVCNTLGTNASSFLLLFIAIDRFRKVCKPFGWQISSRVAKLLCGLSVLLGLFVSWPAFLIYGKHTFFIPHLNLTGTECSTDDSMTKTVWPFLNTAMFGTLFLSGIVTICILYCLIGREVQKHVQKRPPEISRNKSIPMLSSTVDPRDLRISGELSVVTDNKKPKSPKQSTKKRQSKMCKKFSESDVSWGEKKSSLSRSQECKNRSCCTVINNGGDGERDGRELNGVQVGQKGPNNEELSRESSEQIRKTDEEFVKVDEDNSDDVLETGEHVNSFDDVNITDNTYDNIEKDEDKRTSKMSSFSIGSDNCFTQSTNVGNEGTFTMTYDKNSNRSRTPSLSSRFSLAVHRLTSVVSRKSDAGPNAKTQYLKQARARKTAFLMFLISLAFVLSYLPHLLLMLIRQLKRNFVEDMSDSDRAVYRFFLRSYFLNCAINPVIYGVCDSRFRSAVKELWSNCFACSKYESN